MHRVSGGAGELKLLLPHVHCFGSVVGVDAGIDALVRFLLGCLVCALFSASCLAVQSGDAPNFEVFSSFEPDASAEPSTGSDVAFAEHAPSNGSDVDASVLAAMGDHWSRRMRARPGDAFDCQFVLRSQLAKMVQKGNSAQKAIFCSCKESHEVPTVSWSRCDGVSFDGTC